MYNRYIPQPDGTFHRSRVQTESPRQPAPQRHEQPEEKPCEPEATVSKPDCSPKSTGHCRSRQRISRQQPPRQEHTSVPAGAFLKNLLPKDLDTSDLIIIMLLLLMAGDDPEDRSCALLTLALYFFM